MSSLIWLQEMLQLLEMQLEHLFRVPHQPLSSKHKIAANAAFPLSFVQPNTTLLRIGKIEIETPKP